MRIGSSLTIPACIGLLLLGAVAPGVSTGPEPPVHGYIHSLEFSPNGRYLLATSSSNFAGLTRSGMDLIDLSQREGASGKSFCVEYSAKPAPRATATVSTFHPNGKLIVSGESSTSRLGWNPDSTIRFWDIESGKAIRVLTTDCGRIYSLSFSGDGKRLLVGASRGLILWDVEAGKPIRRFTGARVTSVALSKDGKVAVSDDTTEYAVNVWDANTGKRVRHFIAAPVLRKDPHFEGIGHIALSPDSSRVLLTGSKLWIWDIKANQLIHAIDFQEDHTSFNSACFTSTGRFVVGAGEGRPVGLWEVATGKKVLTLKVGASAYPALAISPNGRRAAIAQGAAGAAITVWDLNKGTLIWKGP